MCRACTLRCEQWAGVVFQKIPSGKIGLFFLLSQAPEPFGAFGFDTGKHLWLRSLERFAQVFGLGQPHHHPGRAASKTALTTAYLQVMSG
jgi:hypothetical protein